MSPEDVARGLSAGAARACTAMTTDWQFCGKSTFNANGAFALSRINTGRLCDVEIQKYGKWWRTAYRLTPFGAQVRAILKGE